MFRICRIIVENTEQEISLKEYLGGYPVEITQHLDLSGIVSSEIGKGIPTLFVGWNSVKHRFPEQKIQDNKVMNNLYWTYNELECNEIQGESFHRNIENFVNENLKSWLPSDFLIYDSILNGDFSKFIESNIDKSKLTYVHFNKGAIYMRNGERDFIVNAKSLWLTEANYKNSITDVLNNMNCMVYSYDGIEDYVNLDTLGSILALDIIRWVKYSVETPIKYFQIVPGMDIHKYVPFLMSKIPLESLEMDEDEEVYFRRMSVRDKINRWMSTRYISFSYDFKKNLDFINRDYAKLAKIRYSTKRTITGRITSVDRYNPQNLSKSNDERAMIVSRFRGGQVYQFDFTSFESKIALYLTENDFFIENYYDKDLHAELAIIIFGIDFTEEQRNCAKLINHAIIYGAGDETVLSKFVGVENANEKLIEVKEFLSPIIEVSKKMEKHFNDTGYLINKWGSIIKPNKSFAAFNNYIQSTASEIIIDKVIEIKKLLQEMKSQFMFQVHDSLVFDIHPDEVFLVKEIIDCLSCANNMIFNVDVKRGNNYKDLF